MAAHSDFAPGDVPRVVALTIATSQAAYSIAPLAFGVFLAMAGAVNDMGIGAHTAVLFVLVSCIQIAAAICFFLPAERATVKENMGGFRTNERL